MIDFKGYGHTDWTGFEWDENGRHYRIAGPLESDPLDLAVGRQHWEIEDDGYIYEYELAALALLQRQQEADE